MEIKKYRASGYVYGKYWGGGSGAYQAENYKNDNIEELRKEINKDVETGAIDSGMGYQEVLGAIMNKNCNCNKNIHKYDY